MENNSVFVEVDINNISLNPFCEHGPSVLFTRHLSDGTTTKFYACSACRDRKLCPFYLEEEERKTSTEDCSTSKELELFGSHSKKYYRALKYHNKKLSFCNTCSELIIKEKSKKHSASSCNLIESLSKEQIQFPSQMLSPKSNPKCEAQYFFTSKCLKVIMKTLQDLKIEKMLCIGAPRVHELVRNESNQSCRSLLMDIDDRFCHFFSPEEFIVYNIFNHYFFNGSQSKEVYKKFLKGTERIVLLTDPPFGGRIELIAKTLRTIGEDWREVNCFPPDKILPMIFIFPYFLEKSIKAHIPSLSMLEYQVDYDNHALFTTGPKGLKRGSVVRMFSNLSPNLFAFPEDEGYSLCSPCNRWVHRSNAHCFKCRDCTSKDGRTYKHCDRCGFCVKPARVHCTPCGMCLPLDHQCKSPKEASSRKRKRDKAERYADSKSLANKGSKGTKKKVKKNPLPQSKSEERTRDLAILQQIIRS